MNIGVWRTSDIVAAVNGKMVTWGPPGPISTDTRTLQTGEWFLPLTGQNYKAQHFINPNLSMNHGGSCIGVISNTICQDWDMGFVQIESNTQNTLKDLAIYSRNNFNGCLIGVTGSIGKTTTRNMIALALESAGNVYQTPGNYNNQIGLALSLVGMFNHSNVVDFGVLELGMSEKGEILELSRMSRPNVRVILNVGASHLENFSSLEEIALAKGEIFTEAKPGDVCVLNADDPLVMSLPIPLGVDKVLFGQKKGCNVRLVSAEMIDKGYKVRVVLENNMETVDFVISSPGLHLAHNACAAAGIATSLGVPLHVVAKSLSKFTPVHGRLQVQVMKNGMKLINDAYNASPSSTIAAIHSLKQIECEGKKVVILGDMLELGPTEDKLHEMVLQKCIDFEFDVVGLVGKRFRSAAECLNIGGKINLVCACNAETLGLEIVRDLDCFDVVLVKGSHGMHMEKFVDVIKQY